MIRLKTMTRLNYYDGLFLTAELCDVEQSYTERLNSYHNAMLFSPGTAQGLEVAIANERAISIRQGMAIDDKGRQLVWPDRADAVPLPERFRGFDGVVDVSIAYPILPTLEDEEGSRPQPVVSLKPWIRFGEEGTSPALVLAKLTLAKGKIRKLENVQVPVRLMVGGGEPPPARTALAGKAQVEIPRHGHKTVISKTVTFLPDGKPPFTRPPVVTATVQARGGSVYAVGVSAVSVRGFTAEVSHVAGGSHHDRQRRLIVHWTAQPMSVTQEFSEDEDRD